MVLVPLSTLLSGVYDIPQPLDLQISGLSLDSRAIKSGELFFACLGTQVDGRQFIGNAIQQGARAVLAEPMADQTDIKWQDGVPIIPIKNLPHHISAIAGRFYNHPTKSLQMMGITGTNGKTSCSHFIAAILHQLNLSCGVIGTLGSGVFGQIKPGSLTTPDPITLQKICREFVSLGVKYVAMEVSSHSLVQGRVESIPFAVGIFTNLTRDHLDYHGSMEAYGAAKQLLFEMPLLQNAVINIDDPFGLKLVTLLAAKKNVFTYSTQGKTTSLCPSILATQVILDVSGIRAHLSTPWGEGNLDLPLIGEFNLSNMLAVITSLCLLDIPLPAIIGCLKKLSPVPGRMQTLGGQEKPLVIVDYSHTPDSLQQALIALRRHCNGTLYCVFGCGGDRDRGKGP